jgi:hypothetical protein
MFEKLNIFLESLAVYEAVGLAIGIAFGIICLFMVVRSAIKSRPLLESDTYFDVTVSTGNNRPIERSSIPIEATLLHKEEDIEDYEDHESGGFIVMTTKNEFFWNGKLLYKGDWDDYESHPQGIIIELGDKLFLNSTLMFEGNWDSYESHPRGVLVEDADSDNLYINNKLVYDGEWDSYSSHPEGIILDIDDSLYLLRC